MVATRGHARVLFFSDCPTLQPGSSVSCGQGPLVSAQSQVILAGVKHPSSAKHAVRPPQVCIGSRGVQRSRAAAVCHNVAKVPDVLLQDVALRAAVETGEGVVVPACDICLAAGGLTSGARVNVPAVCGARGEAADAPRYVELVGGCLFHGDLPLDVRGGAWPVGNHRLCVNGLKRKDGPALEAATSITCCQRAWRSSKAKIVLPLMNNKGLIAEDRHQVPINSDVH
mmetsp:Transcript_15502/g.43396  ORF Transcript_15502/g.43396 Transcript_15502/m.43396 type:complete len:227 (+) Transcript_15502:284-964(+)